MGGVVQSAPAGAAHDELVMQVLGHGEVKDGWAEGRMDGGADALLLMDPNVSSPAR
jgi:hypothetical protein